MPLGEKRGSEDTDIANSTLNRKFFNAGLLRTFVILYNISYMKLKRRYRKMVISKFSIA